jgi:hypothetical protein
MLWDEMGGFLIDYWKRWQALALSGDDVEIRGICQSACTLIMVYVPNDRLCFGETASLQFHSARRGSEPDIAVTQWMISQYPQDIRLWIKNKGGWEKMTVVQMWTLTAPELWAMGYQKCAPEVAPDPAAAPVPMTITKITTMPRWSRGK